MSNDKTFSGREIFKWGIFGVSLYLNYLGTIAILFKLISLAIILSHVSVKMLIIGDVVFFLLKLGLLILALVLVNSKLKGKSVVLFPRGWAIASFILLPVILLLQYAAQAGNTVLMSTVGGAAYMGKYTMFLNIFSLIGSGLLLITIMIFGLIVSSRN